MGSYLHPSAMRPYPDGEDRLSEQACSALRLSSRPPRSISPCLAGCSKNGELQRGEEAAERRWRA
jgi:hypothetical protein